MDELRLRKLISTCLVGSLPVKCLVVAIALIGTSLPAGAQTTKGGKMKGQNTGIKMREIEDKIELRELVDTFSVMADKKEARKQTELFTEDATVETYINGALVTKLHGRKEIGDTFENFLKNFNVVYHFNGQHLVSIQGDRATGTLYCMTYLFGKENGKRVKTTFGIRYNDEYVREKGKWLISKRTSFFEWQERNDVP